MFISPFVASLENTRIDCDEVELFIANPKDGSILDSKEFKVEFGSENILISPAGVNPEQKDKCLISGHHHLIINNAYDVNEKRNDPIPFERNILHFGGGQTEATLSLPPGKYTLQLALGDYEHMPVQVSNSNQTNGLAVSKIVSIEIL
ncbi:MAG: hypothetical protein CMQ93_03735 [Gammaproteobacteria bacterium]|nr:hypothetical protein [Gammaproteobacteria bacterium]